MALAEHSFIPGAPRRRAAASTPIYRTAVVTVGLIAALVVAVFGLTQSVSTVSAAALSVDLGRLTLATALEVSLLAWTVILWSQIIASFDVAAPALPALFRIWRRSTLAKYLPGAVWSAVATAEAADRARVSTVAVTASFLIQATFTLLSSVVVSTILLGPASWGRLTGMIGALGAGICLARPSAINGLVRFVAKRTGGTAPRWIASWTVGIGLLLLHLLTWLAYGAVFAVLLAALTPAAAGASWALLAGINAGAFAAGFVAVFAPGGIGVRESILVLLLTPIIPALGTRITIAAASRVWLACTEALGAALSVAVTVHARRGAARRAAIASPSDGRTCSRHRPRPTTVGAMLPTDADVLVDSRRALAVIVARCRTAQRSIAISQLAFDSDCAPVTEGAIPAESLLDVLVACARRGVDVRIVLNGGLLLDTTPALRRGLSNRGADRTLQLRTIQHFPRMMHAKSIVIDERDAFLMGASFVNGYWSGAAHTADGHPNAFPGDGERPLHDVAIHLRGGAARTLSACFEDLWSAAARDHAESAPSMDDVDRSIPHDPAGDVMTSGTSVTRIARTAPQRRDAAGCTEILDEYLSAIDDARDYIYLESQYFSARPIAKAVRDALAAHRDLQIIAVINQNPDITGYRAWQNARLREHRLLEHPRVGVFALWSTVPSWRVPGKTEITQVFVHSKVALIDDRCSIIGSANLDGASLHSYADDFTSRLGRRFFPRVRNYDVAAVVTDSSNNRDGHGVAARSRRALWARHLGECADRTTRPSDGWLPLWRAAARANVLDLRSGNAMRGRILPYVTAPHPRRQLAALGIADERLCLRFDPGFAEVAWSPSWMKRLVPERWRARP